MGTIKKMMLTASAFVALQTAEAQLKVKTNGKIIVGTELVGSDPNNELKMHIFGGLPGGAGSKLAFGDFGTFALYGSNVFVGEYGTTDTDQLWLHGRDGVYLTYGNAAVNQTIGYFNIAQSDRFNFNVDVYAKGVKINSDARYKTNIKKLANAMDVINKIDGMSYNLLSNSAISGLRNGNTVNSARISTTNTTTVGVSLSEKERKSKAKFEAIEAQQAANKNEKLGFVAQEIKKVLPQLVDTDSAGFMSVDYMGLIPVIVEALKEKDAAIKILAAKVAKLEGKKSGARAETTEEKDLKNESKTILYQNTPNPFSQETSIKYSLPETVQNAFISITDLNGKQLKSLQITTKGESSVSLKANELYAGLFVYTLVADGNIIDSKRMVIVE